MENTYSATNSTACEESLMSDEFMQKYGVTDMVPVRKVKPVEPLITPAEWAEVDARKANAAYVGRLVISQGLNAPINRLLADAFRLKASVKRKQAIDGTSHPDKFPDVAIRSPEASSAASIADMLDALADDLDRIV
jgi:hypothetical protein